MDTGREAKQKAILERTKIQKNQDHEVHWPDKNAIKLEKVYGK